MIYETEITHKKRRKKVKREEILRKAHSLINGPRAKVYGDAYENHERIAMFWSIILDKEITVSQVYQCMVAVKQARLIISPNHEDSWVDIAGYAALAGEKTNG